MKIVLPTMLRPMIESRIRKDVEILWFDRPEEAMALVADADVACLDMRDRSLFGEIVRRAGRLKWLFTMAAGVDFFDLAPLRDAGRS